MMWPRLRFAHDHLRRRLPVRPLLLAADMDDAVPAEALAADADAVADRLAVAEDVDRGNAGSVSMMIVPGASLVG